MRQDRRLLDPAKVRAVLLGDGQWHDVILGRTEEVLTWEGSVSPRICFIAVRKDGTGELVIPLDQIQGWIMPRSESPAGAPQPWCSYLGCQADGTRETIYYEMAVPGGRCRSHASREAIELRENEVADL